MKKIFKILYGVFFAAVIVIAVGVIVPLLPIPGNYQLLTILSGSMEPKIHTGSIVAVKPSDNYKIGDVITFGGNGNTKTPTTHRVHDIRVEKGKPIYITKGDANNAPDSKEVLPEEISGKVLFSVPLMGYAISAAKKPLGFMLIIIIPAVIIIGDEIKRIGKEVKKMKKKKSTPSQSPPQRGGEGREKEEEAKELKIIN